MVAAIFVATATFVAILDAKKSGYGQCAVIIAALRSLIDTNENCWLKIGTDGTMRRRPTISVSWSARRAGNDGYVLEQRSDGTETEFGPMPPHIVPAFITGRRRIVARVMERRGNPYILAPNQGLLQ